MLKTLAEWRFLSSDKQLAAFEAALTPLCSQTMRPDNIQKRYQDSYHVALKHKSMLTVASFINQEKPSQHWYHNRPDLGQDLMDMLANGQGWIACADLKGCYAEAAVLLLQRGVLFEHEQCYCLPAEFLAEMCNKKNVDTWFAHISNTAVALLKQMLPAEVLAAMSPSPLRNEMAAWLMVHSLRARENKPEQDLNDQDWSLLLTLQHHHITEVQEVSALYPDMPVVLKESYFYSHVDPEPSLKLSLFAALPEQLGKLCRLGLLYIAVRSGDENHAEIALSHEGFETLKPQFKKEKGRVADRIKQDWFADNYAIDQPSPWYFEQLIWKVWVAAHFVPLSLTKQGYIRKGDSKKLQKMLQAESVDHVMLAFSTLFTGGLLRQKEERIQPAPIDWKKWLKQQRVMMMNILQQWDKWSKAEEKQAFALLAQLPHSCWLKIDTVVAWLQTQSNGKLLAAHWMDMFTLDQTTYLHHLSQEQTRIYLMPLFADVVQNNAVHFTAPGWLGADKKAVSQGFVSAAAEIQLPPDCSHAMLKKLAGFCSLSQIEHMITLQLDNTAIKRMGTDKKALNTTRKVLESLQKPLPQPVIYMLDKQANQQAIAKVAPASLVLVLEDESALFKLQHLGFTLLQPFPDKAEIVLLDAAEDAHLFLETCAQQGVVVQALLQPKAWITGAVAVQAWMSQKISRNGHWLELVYQKTRVSKTKQVFARIEFDEYGYFSVRCVKYSKKTCDLVKNPIDLAAKHILRLRELPKDEVSSLGFTDLT